MQGPGKKVRVGVCVYVWGVHTTVRARVQYGMHMCRACSVHEYMWAYMYMCVWACTCGHVQVMPRAHHPAMRSAAMCCMLRMWQS